jgi:sigma-B regulation protein RsbU (phosphoserine phosphatase)
MNYVNGEIADSNEASMFVTLFAAVLDVRTGELRYTNAGHNPPYAKRRNNGSLVRLAERHGPVLGAVTGTVYGEDKITLGSGDLIVLYTDGLTEAMNSSATLYSEPRFAEWLAGSQANAVEDVVAGVVDDVKRFEGDAPQADDLTVLALRFHGAGSDASVAEMLELELTNQLTQIDRVNEAFSTFATERHVDQSVIRQFKLVFDELLNNTITHGFQDDEEHVIRVSLRLSDDRLTVAIADDGAPFNPLKFGAPMVEASIEKREVGGLGLHLVRNIMDEVRYRREEDENVVTVVKYLRSSERPPSDESQPIP